MERKTKEFVCECSDDIIVVGEGDIKLCPQCGEEFRYNYESMETMYQDLVAMRKLANKICSNLWNIHIQLNLIVTATKENRSFEEIKEKILQTRETSIEYMISAMNELRFFYGKDDCEDCE